MGQGDEWGYVIGGDTARTQQPHQPKKEFDGAVLMLWGFGTFLYIPIAAWVFLGVMNFFLDIIFQMPAREQEEFHNVIIVLTFAATVLTPVFCVFVWKYLDYRKLKLQLAHERQMRLDEWGHEEYRQIKSS